MSQERFDRLFQYIDVARWVLYGLFAGTVGIAVWATKLQMTIGDLEKQINGMEQNSSIHRDSLKEKETQAEHRITAIEKDNEWIRYELSQLQHAHETH
jgi:hypothetical protein